EAEAPRHVEREAHVDLALDVAPTHVEAAPDDGAAGDQAQALGAPGERAVNALSGRDQVVGARALAKKEVVDIRGEPAAALAAGHAGGARVGPAAITLVFGRIVVAVAPEVPHPGREPVFELQAVAELSGATLGVGGAAERHHLSVEAGTERAVVVADGGDPIEEIEIGELHLLPVRDRPLQP